MDKKEQLTHGPEWSWLEIMVNNETGQIDVISGDRNEDMTYPGYETLKRLIPSMC